MKTIDKMRHAVMNTIRANGKPVTGDIWFSLVFRTESELTKICQELNINVAAL